jgi:hypothetical protein
MSYVKTPEHRQKLSEALKGRKMSDEFRQKCRDAQILYNKNKKLNTIPPKPHTFF